MNKLLFILTLGLSLAAQAHPTLTEADAVRALADHNPTLRAAMLDVQQSAEAVRAESARYRPNLLLDATATTQATPSLNLTGGTTRSVNQALVFGADLTQTFAWGTSFDLRLENRNSSSQGPAFSGTSDIITLGPGYGLTGKLSLTQPLLRGFGTEVGQADLRARLLERSEAQRARDAAASDALSSMLQAYWELWYAQKALQIQEDARTLAQQQLDETRRKVQAGSVADFDLLTNETRGSELDQAVLSAQVTVQTQTIALSRTLGQLTTSSSLDVSQASPFAVDAPDSAAAIAQAQEASYTVAQQQLALESAQNAARSSADATRPRLDVQAWVQTQGLGNQSFAPAATQLGTFSNVSGNVGLVFELPLSSERHDAQVQKARLAVRAAEERLAAAKLQVAADTATELATLEQARQKIALAERSADVSSRSAQAQHKRYLNGSGLAIEVREAEDSLRQARLSVERERVNAIKAQLRLTHLTGTLLTKWGL